jgi:hypothetical protein
MIKQMTDLETMSVRSNALILSMGFCRFNINTQKIYDELLLNIDFKKSLIDYPGKFNVMKETVDFWSKQNREILASIYESQIPLEEAIDKIYTWFQNGKEIWCWGAAFDIPILEHAIRVTGKLEQYGKMPWSYGNVRCARTVASVFNEKIERSSGHHNALSDCIDQSKVIMKILKTS